MLESPKKKKSENPKDSKISRATILTFVSLVLAVGVIVVAAVATNRSKKNELPLPSTDNQPSNTQKPENKLPEEKVPEEDNEQEETEKPKPAEKTDAPAESGDGDEQVENTLPSFILPVSGVLSSKHDPTLQVFSNTMNDYRVHLGIDIATDASAPVYAAADGTVSKVWKDSLMGYCMAIEHSGDCFTIYKNLSETLPEGIAEGTKVRAGQLVASVGESAMVEIADEPHLHFEMTVADLAVDPLEYFDEKSLESLSIDASYEE
jgi:murein DD-endopeptidase MepM/ murein hydrolase activator NlpD